MTNRKGIVLAGGSGTRLYPLTMGISKQLLPIYDKPMIYYPISVLMLGGIRDIAVITTSDDQAQFIALLGDGSQWGVSFTYIVQPAPEGLAQAFILAESFLNGSPSTLILGDNIFFGHGLPDLLTEADVNYTGASIFGYRVADPERYGVIDFDAEGRVLSIIEKPSMPPSNFAVTGLYFVDGTAAARAKEVRPSARNELEITSLLEMYLEDDQLTLQKMGRGFAWLDTGTHDSLIDASNFVRTLTKRQGQQIGSPDEIAFNQGFITTEQLKERAIRFQKSDYGLNLLRLLEEQ
jgi:glucose-1-phosphate thymidylyltransferase